MVFIQHIVFDVAVGLLATNVRFPHLICKNMLKKVPTKDFLIISL